MNLQQLRLEIISVLNELNYPSQDINYLISFILQTPRNTLPSLSPEYSLSDAQIKLYQKVISQLKTNTPTAYIVGYQEFYGERFKVGPQVLIPRPETEELVRKAIVQITNISQKLNRKVNIIEVGVGSANITASVIKHAQNYLDKYIGFEPSKSANVVGIANINHILDIKIANKNPLISNNPKLTILAKRFSKGEKMIKPLYKQPVVLLANPPYIPLKFLANTPPSVTFFEPAKALFAGEDGLDVIREIVDYINSTACLSYAIIEIDHRTIEDITDYIELTTNKNLKNSRYYFSEDQFGKIRFLEYMK